MVGNGINVGDMNEEKERCGRICYRSCFDEKKRCTFYNSYSLGARRTQGDEKRKSATRCSRHYIYVVEAVVHRIYGLQDFLDIAKMLIQFISSKFIHVIADKIARIQTNRGMQHRVWIDGSF